jgi:hypothetical protein
MITHPLCHILYCKPFRHFLMRNVSFVAHFVASCIYLCIVDILLLISYLAVLNKTCLYITMNPIAVFFFFLNKIIYIFYSKRYMLHITFAAQVSVGEHHNSEIGGIRAYKKGVSDKYEDMDIGDDSLCI